MTSKAIDIAAELTQVNGFERLSEAFVAAIRSVERAQPAMRAGDPLPYIALWEKGVDSTLFGAWGPIEKGSDRLAETFRWVGSRFTGGRVKCLYATVWESDDIGVTVGFERGSTSIDGSDDALMVIRVTHVYHRVADEWALVHRHADFPPADQRA